MTALFGGAFDPPHLGHVALLEGARRHFSPDWLVVLVVAAPGHKRVYADSALRLAFARAAFPGSEVELDWHSRTIDLLRDVAFPDPLILIGADELVDFPDWKEPDAILELARLGVATRPGYPQDKLEGVLERLTRPERVFFFEIEAVPVSSSEIRERVARGEPIDVLVPSGAARAIADSGAYRR